MPGSVAAIDSPETVGVELCEINSTGTVASRPPRGSIAVFHGTGTVVPAWTVFTSTVGDTSPAAVG